MEAMARGAMPIVSRFSAQPESVYDFGYIVNEICKDEIRKKIEMYFGLSNKEKNILKNNILDFSHKKSAYNFRLKNLKNIISELN